MTGNKLMKMLSIEHPIIQGPLGGGPSTPELVAAVSNAGGLGSLGAAYLSAEQIIETVRRIRALTDRPFNINLFSGGWRTDTRADAAPMLALLAEVHAALGLPPPAAPIAAPDPFPAQLEAVLETRAPIFSFTFGIPGRDALARIRSRGILIHGNSYDRGGSTTVV